MINPSLGEQPTGYPQHVIDGLVWLEAAVVVAAAPFLFFPELSPLATFVALAALVVVWLLPPIVQRQPGLPPTLFNVALIPWGLVLIVAILVSADPELTLPKAAGVILGLAVWRVLVRLGVSRVWARYEVLGFVALGCGLVVLGALSLDQILKVPALSAVDPARWFSLSDQFGLSTHPNELAGLICLVLPLLVSLLFGWRPSRRRVALRAALLVLVLLLVGALLYTQSRGGWIAVTGGLFVLLAAWALLMPPSAGRKVARAATLTAVLVALGLFLWAGPSRLQQLWLEPPVETAVGTLTTLNYRKELWPWALAAARDFSLTGTGLGTFREVVFRLYPVKLSPIADIGHAHNIFLQTALDVGLPGLVVYVALLMLALGGAWKVATLDRQMRPAALGLLAGLVALHIFGLADALALGSKPGLMFWYALGLIAAMSHVAAPTRKSA